MRYPRHRFGWPALIVLVDLVREAWWSRNALLALALLLAAVAVAAAFVGHAVVPWAIYPAL